MLPDIPTRALVGFHIVPAIALVVYALTGKGASLKTKWESYNNYWIDDTYNLQAVRSWTRVPNETALFTVDPPSNSLVPDINILALSIIYMMWSSCIWAVCPITYARWIDYTVSAPIMLVVIALLFNATSITAILIGPAALCMAIIIGGVAELRAKRMNEPYVRLNALVCCWALFLIAWVPVYVALYATFNEADDDGPPFIIWLILTLLFLLFAGFGIIYRKYEITTEDTERDRAFALASVVTKTVLHIFIGILGIQQSRMAVAADSEYRPDDDTYNGSLYIGFAAAIVVPIFYYYFAKKVFTNTGYSKLLDNSAAFSNIKVHIGG